MKVRLALPLLAAAMLAVAGCSKHSQIEIQSDTCWSGLINSDQSISECGNASYKIVGALGCVQVHKLTANGYLRIRINGGPWSETTAPNGTAQACP